VLGYRIVHLSLRGDESARISVKRAPGPSDRYAVEVAPPVIVILDLPFKRVHHMPYTVLVVIVVAAGRTVWTAGLRQVQALRVEPERHFLRVTGQRLTLFPNTVVVRVILARLMFQDAICARDSEVEQVSGWVICGPVLSP